MTSSVPYPVAAACLHATGDSALPPESRRRSPACNISPGSRFVNPVMHGRPSLGARCRSTCDCLVGVGRTRVSRDTFYPLSFVHHTHSITSFERLAGTFRRRGVWKDCCLDNLSSRRVDRLVALVLALVCGASAVPVGCSPSRFCCCFRCRARLDFRRSRDCRARGASNAHVALRLRHSRRIFAGPHSSHSRATRSSESSLTRDARGRRSTSSAAECPADSPLEH